MRAARSADCTALCHEHACHQCSTTSQQHRKLHINAAHVQDCTWKGDYYNDECANTCAADFSRVENVSLASIAVPVAELLWNPARCTIISGMVYYLEAVSMESSADSSRRLLAQVWTARCVVRSHACAVDT